jgi:hypothetical protein
MSEGAAAIFRSDLMLGILNPKKKQTVFCLLQELDSSWWL